MEILWFRHFSIMLGAFRAVFSLLLTVILVGIGAGALLASVVLGAASRRIGTPAKAARWLMAIQALFIVFTLMAMAAADSSVIDRTVSAAINDLGDASFAGRAGLAQTWQSSGSTCGRCCRRWRCRRCSWVSAFRSRTPSFSAPSSPVGRRAGVLYLANTAGAVAGSLVAGFLLLPVLGLQGSATVLMLAAALGLIPLYLAGRDSRTQDPESQADPKARSLHLARCCSPLVRS